MASKPPEGRRVRTGNRILRPDTRQTGPRQPHGPQLWSRGAKTPTTGGCRGRGARRRGRAGAEPARGDAGLVATRGGRRAGRRAGGRARARAGVRVDGAGPLHDGLYAAGLRR